MKPFYRFLMSYRDDEEGTEYALFAEHVYQDHTFPKQSTSYHELSSYLEMNGEYLLDMSLFDEVWRFYEESFGTKLGSDLYS